MLVMNVPYAAEVKRESVSTGRSVYEILKDALGLYFKKDETASTAKPSKRIFEAMGAVNVKEPVSVTWTRDEINERG